MSEELFKNLPADISPTPAERRAVELLLRIESGRWHKIDPDEEHRDFPVAAHRLVIAGLAAARIRLTVAKPASPEAMEFCLRVTGYWSPRSVVINSIGEGLRQFGWLKDSNLATPLIFKSSPYTALQITEIGEQSLSNARGNRAAVAERRTRSQRQVGLESLEHLAERFKRRRNYSDRLEKTTSILACSLEPLPNAHSKSF